VSRTSNDPKTPAARHPPHPEQLPDAPGGPIHSAMVSSTLSVRGFLLMMEDAIRYGANAIVGFRYDTTDIGRGLTEVLAYGTAIWAEPASS
jgi:hypothetical protein